MSTPTSGNYTNDLFSKFSLVRKTYFISDKKIELSRIEYQASGIICLITSVAMICLASLQTFNPLIGSVVIISGSILYLALFISSIREGFAKNVFAGNIRKEILKKKILSKSNI